MQRRFELILDFPIDMAPMEFANELQKINEQIRRQLFAQFINIDKLNDFRNDSKISYSYQVVSMATESSES